MSHSVGSSDVGDVEEDPNIPTGVDCCGENDDLSISSELSDRSMEHYGLTYNCKPDISEVANLTKAVNYGDFAKMAGTCSDDRRSHFESQGVVVVVGDSAEDDAQKHTWSQLLDNQGRQRQREPRLLGEKDSFKSFIWTRGYDETSNLSGLSLVFPEPLSTIHKLPRRPSGITYSLTRLSCPLLLVRQRQRPQPRPISAIKRFLAQENVGIPSMFVKECSFNTADTTKSNRCRCVEAAGTD